jgi:hypothetical protein
VEPSQPQETPLRALGSRDVSIGATDRPARVQMVIALFLGLVLVAIPLYLWRRPRAETPVVQSEPHAQAETTAGAIEGAAVAIHADADAGTGVTFADPRVECHDHGSKKTAPSDCDHLTAFEKAFAQAIDRATPACAEVATGNLSYVADVSFARKKNPIAVTFAKASHIPKSNRSTPASSCIGTVKQSLPATLLEGVSHAHERYKIEIDATYPKHAATP